MEGRVRLGNQEGLVKEWKEEKMKPTKVIEEAKIIKSETMRDG